MALKIVLITDIHYDVSDTTPGRNTSIADILLLRAVHRVNRFIKPDVVVVLGDLVDLANAPSAVACLERMAAIFGLIQAPAVIIPGNHDPAIETFSDIVGDVPPWLDVKGTRLVPFLDPEEPEYNARRTSAGLDHMAEARRGFAGPIIALQHVPVFPPGRSDCPYNLVNAPDVVDAMRTNNISLALAGHYHRGMDLVRDGNLAFLAGPALCEAPFSFLEILMDGDNIDIRRHQLRLPEQLGLVDTHVHTQFAYCGENVSIERDLAFADVFGLRGLRVTEHSGQLYFNADTFWNARFLDQGVRAAKADDRRMDAYFDALRDAGCPDNAIGLEVDCDAHGRAVLLEKDRTRATFFNGAIHYLPELRKPDRDLHRAEDEYLAVLGPFLATGIDVLAHPFRVFRRAKAPVPERLFRPVIELLRAVGVAAEINFHSQEPSADFVTMCLENGVKLALGSDAHNLYEIGELWPHLRLLEACGFNGDLDDILVKP